MAEDPELAEMVREYNLTRIGIPPAQQATLPARKLDYFLAFRDVERAKEA